ARAAGLHAERAVGQFATHGLAAEDEHVLAGRLERDLGLRVQGVLRAFERARRTRQEALQLLVGRLVQVGLQDRELVGLGLVVPGVRAGVTGAGQGAVTAVGR